MKKLTEFFQRDQSQLGRLTERYCHHGTILIQSHSMNEAWDILGVSEVKLHAE